MLKQGLKQVQTQKLSPQQIQLMKLLKIPTLALEQRIKQELEANPALEEGPEELPLELPEDEQTRAEAEVEPQEPGNQEEKDSLDEIEWSEYYEDDDIPDYKTRSNYNQEEDERPLPVAVEESFNEYIREQASMLNLSEKERILADQLVGNIDEDGYLRRALENIVDDLAFMMNIHTTVEELESVLKKIQTLDPPGVGARDLRECLLLQLDRIEHEGEDVRLARKILEDHFDEFAKKHYEKLQKSLNIDEETLKRALDVILKLNPKPGSAYTSEWVKNTEAIIPDFIIQNDNGDLQLILNQRNAPELRINPEYRRMIEEYARSKNKTRQQKEAMMFIKQKIDSARWFIDAIRQRQETLLKTMQAIMDYQRDFFLTGDETKLKPMILKDIANITGLDISTVSRVANSKYVQTEFGTFPLKYFFSESLSTDSGEEVSTREVKKILQELIEAEDKRKPLSDQKLMELLNKRGYNIARRTVAKYREQLNIPVARLRKQI